MEFFNQLIILSINYIPMNSYYFLWLLLKSFETDFAEKMGITNSLFLAIIFIIFNHLAVLRLV